MIKTATLTIAMVITLSVNAQNTKSLKENRFTKKLDKIVKENLADFTNTLANLKKSVQFKPEVNFEYTNEVNEAVIDLSEVELFVKYTPSTYSEISMSEGQNKFDTVLADLKEMVQYKPYNEAAEVKAELKKATDELALIVRYQPES
jgi:hypothetical protein